MKRSPSKIILAMIVVAILAIPAVLMAGEKIDLNSADIAKLVTIKGIGQSLAQRIIDYRKEHGPYEKIEDVMKVKGISNKKFELIKDAIMVESE